jgi:hypothetical protein
MAKRMRIIIEINHDELGEGPSGAKFDRKLFNETISQKVQLIFPRRMFLATEECEDRTTLRGRLQ